MPDSKLGTTEETLAEANLRRAHNSFAEAQRLSRTGSYIVDIVTDEFMCSDEA